MNKKILAGILCPAMALAAAMPVTPAFALNQENTEGKTKVTYVAEQTGWLWTIPAAQNFNGADYNAENKTYTTKPAAISISPADGKDTILLPPNTKIDIKMSSTQLDAADTENKTFQLVNADSSINYQIKNEDSELLANGVSVLSVNAGSANEEGKIAGATQNITLETTDDNIAKATLSGVHTDTLTFNMALVSQQSEETTIKYSVTTMVENGKIKVNGSESNNGNSVEVDRGANVTITVEPNDGYHVGTVTVNGNTVTLDENNQHTINDVQNYYVIQATFIEDSTT